MFRVLSGRMARLIGEVGPKGVEAMEGPMRPKKMVAVTDNDLDISDQSERSSATHPTPSRTRVDNAPPSSVRERDSQVQVRELQYPLQGWRPGRAPVSPTRYDSHEKEQGSSTLTTPEAQRQGQRASQFAAEGQTSFHVRGNQERSVRFGAPSPARRRQWSDRAKSARNAFHISSRLSVNERFAEPMTSECGGSVFPKEVTMDERRQYELELIQKFDRADINKRVGEFWYLIDAGWMNRWISFVLGKSPPPGPITNSNLFDKTMEDSSQARRESMLVTHAVHARSNAGSMASYPDLKLKPNMQKVRDYRAIHALVWYLLREMYDTDDAPEVCRWTPDIYAPEVTATRKLRLETESHTKAVYELRRYLTKINEDIEERLEQEVEENEEESRRSGRRRF